MNNNTESVTATVWRTGRERGMTNKEIRANWKSLYQEVYTEKVDYARIGLNAILSELENTIKSYTKSPVTEQAEIVSLENIKQVVNAFRDKTGYVTTFNAFAKIYDNGAGEWVQRILAAIYDTELAQWASGMPAYMARMQSEIVNKMEELTGVEISMNELDLKDPSDVDINDIDKDTESEMYKPIELDVEELKRLLGL